MPTPEDTTQAAQSLVLDIVTAGKMLGLGRSQAYEAAARGTIPTIRLSERRLVVPRARLEAMLGLSNGRGE